MNSFFKAAFAKSMVDDQALAGCCSAKAAGSLSAAMTMGLPPKSAASRLRSW
jgi:hypothetical protein